MSLVDTDTCRSLTFVHFLVVLLYASLIHTFLCLFSFWGVAPSTFILANISSFEISRTSWPEKRLKDTTSKTNIEPENGRRYNIYIYTYVCERYIRPVTCSYRNQSITRRNTRSQSGKPSFFQVNFHRPFRLVPRFAGRICWPSALIWMSLCLLSCLVMVLENQDVLAGCGILMHHHTCLSMVNNSSNYAKKYRHSLDLPPTQSNSCKLRFLVGIPYQNCMKIPVASWHPGWGG